MSDEKNISSHLSICVHGEGGAYTETRHNTLSLLRTAAGAWFNMCQAPTVILKFGKGVKNVSSRREVGAGYPYEYAQTET